MSATQSIGSSSHHCLSIHGCLLASKPLTWYAAWETLGLDTDAASLFRVCLPWVLLQLSSLLRVLVTETALLF